MARAPFNVAVYPYRQVGDGEFEYALLKRADAGFWQGVSGGGQDDETPIETARRETFEETGIPPDALFFQLDTVEPIPVTEFGNSHLWGIVSSNIKNRGFDRFENSCDRRRRPKPQLLDMF